MADFISFLIDNIKMVRIRDIIDVAIVSFALYKCIKLIKETRAAQLIKGVLILVVFTQLSGWLQLNATNYILSNTMQVGVFALLVVFQPELRRVLERVGSKSLLRLSNQKKDINATEQTIERTVAACGILSRERTGVLLVFERSLQLDDYFKSGTMIDALTYGSST